MTREEHLAWCKQRALEYVNAGDLPNAVASMASDMSKHDETRRPRGDIVTGLGMIFAANGDTEGVRKWIEGFA